MSHRVLGAQFKDWFHGTAHDRVDRIRESGLRPSEPGLATLTTDRAEAESYARETASFTGARPVLLHFQTPHSEVRQDGKQPRIGRLDRPLPPERLRAVHSVTKYAEGK